MIRQRVLLAKEEQLFSQDNFSLVVDFVLRLFLVFQVVLVVDLKFERWLRKNQNLPDMFFIFKL